MTDSESFWFNDGAITVENAEDNTDLALAGLKGVTITPGFEMTQYYTADSTLWHVAKQYEHSVAVEIDYAFFNLDVAKQWLGGEGTTAATATTDTSDPMKYKVEVVTPSSKDAWERTVAADTVVFPEMPVVDGSQDEMEEYGLSGTGKEVTNLADTSGA